MTLGLEFLVIAQFAEVHIDGPQAELLTMSQYNHPAQRGLGEQQYAPQRMRYH